MRSRVDPLRRWLYLGCGAVLGLGVGASIFLGEGHSTPVVVSGVAGLALGGGVLAWRFGDGCWERAAGWFRWWTGLRDRGPL